MEFIIVMSQFSKYFQSVGPEAAAASVGNSLENFLSYPKTYWVKNFDRRAQKTT